MERENNQTEKFLMAFFCLIIAVAASLCEWAAHPRRGLHLIVPITPDDLRFND